MSRTIATLSVLAGVLLCSFARAGEPADRWPVPVEAATYKPQFSTAKSEFGHYWILDHGRRIALLGCSKQGTGAYTIGLFRQFPGQQLDETKAADAEVLDYVALPGLRLNTDWISAPAMKDVPGELKLDNSDPAQLTIRLSWKKSAEEFGTQVIRVTYDQDLARYVMHVEDNLQVKEPGGGEYCNFYAHGLGDFRPWIHRYNRLLYNDADDGNKLKVHRLSGPVPQPGNAIHLPLNNALIGYVDEKDGNPVVIVEESTPRTSVAICLCWFDAHLHWDEVHKVDRSDRSNPRSSYVPAVAGPPYCYHAKFRAYWINSAETSSLLAKAQPVSLEPYADRFKNGLPIEMNVVNDLEHPTDAISGKVNGIHIGLKPSAGITHETTIGRSGHSSIRFVSKTDKGAETSMGPELMVTPGRQVKISAWVKTADVSGEGFYLETGFSSNGEQLGPKYRSAKLTGTHEWTLLEIPLPVTPPRTSFLGNQRITFRLSGQGTVWVDDFVFAEQDAGGPAVCDPRALVKP